MTTTTQPQPDKATGLRRQMVLRKVDAVDLQVSFDLDAKLAHAIYWGSEEMTLNQLGAIAKWLRVRPSQLLTTATGQAPA